MSKNKRPPDYGDREARLRKAYERLGTDTPHCLICRQTNPFRLELHHPAQRQYDDETIILCSGHHDEASDWQKDHPLKIDGSHNTIEIQTHWLFGLGDLLKIAASEPQGAELRELLVYAAAELHAVGHIFIHLAKSTKSGETEGVA